MRLISVLSLLLVSCGSGVGILPPAQPLPTPEPKPTELKVFEKPGADYYRIPTTLKMPNGDLLVFAARIHGGFLDSAPSSVEYRKISAGTLTMGPVQTVVHSEGFIYGTPSPIILPGGEVALLIDRRIGGTASKEICNGTSGLTTLLYKLTANGFVLDADVGAAIVATHPGYKGKTSPSTGFTINGAAYMPFMFIGPEADCDNRLHLSDLSSVMSTATGFSWSVVQDSLPGTNESSIWPLDNGWMISSRTYGHFVSGIPNFRLLARFSPPDSSYEYLPTPNNLVHGGLAVFNGITYVSYPHSNTRENLTVFRTDTLDSQVIEPLKSGYSNLFEFDDRLSIVYETGVDVPYGDIMLRFVEGL